jgi:hypothetical protein
MPTPDDHWCELKGELNVLRHSLTERIEKLENVEDAATEVPQTSVQRLWELLSPSLVPIISGAVILALGYAVKDSVDQALAREQLNLSYVSQMQELLEKIRSPGVTREQAGSAAVVLASFGARAAPHLVNELQFEGVRALAAQSGLQAMTLIAPGKACEPLVRVITNRSRLYHWETHKRAIELLGDLECSGDAAVVTAYRQDFERALGQEDYQSYAILFSRDSQLNRDSMSQISDALQNTVEILGVKGG